MSIIFIHELGHLVAAKLFKWRVDKIYVYPLGGIIKFNESINRKIIEEFFVVLTGPLFQIIYSIVLFYFEIKNILFFSFLLLFFNLLPIYPLDGGKICNMIFSLFFSYKKSFFLCICISIVFYFFSFMIFIFYFKIYYFIFVFFSLFFKIIDEVYNFDYIYNKFLLERYLNFFKFTKISFVEDIFSFYRNRNHFSYKKNIIVSEREMLKDFFE